MVKLQVHACTEKVSVTWWSFWYRMVILGTVFVPDSSRLQILGSIDKFCRDVVNLLLYVFQEWTKSIT